MSLERGTDQAGGSIVRIERAIRGGSMDVKRTSGEEKMSDESRIKMNMGSAKNTEAREARQSKKRGITSRMPCPQPPQSLWTLSQLYINLATINPGSTTLPPPNSLASTQKVIQPTSSMEPFTDTRSPCITAPERGGCWDCQ